MHAMCVCYHRRAAGLGDPLLGPSAIEAVASGVMFINPEYDTPKQDIYHSQHPFLKNQVCDEAR